MNTLLSQKPASECNSIQEVRQSIDALDRRIIQLIAARAKYVEKAAEFKDSTASVRDPERVRAALSQRAQWARDKGLSETMIEELFQHLINHFIGRELHEWTQTQPQPD